MTSARAGKREQSTLMQDAIPRQQSVGDPKPRRRIGEPKPRFDGRGLRIGPWHIKPKTFKDRGIKYHGFKATREF